MNQKWYCPGCKKELDYVLMDGYPFGDRLLEGVLFKVFFTPDRKVEVRDVEEGCKPYFEKLNQKMWFERAQKYAEKNDLFTCSNPECKYDVAPDDANPT